MNNRTAARHVPAARSRRRWRWRSPEQWRCHRPLRGSTHGTSAHNATCLASARIKEGTTFVFHGLRKNACCYLLELGLNDSQVGAMLGMSATMVRHYGKRARALMIARDAAISIRGGTLGAAPGTVAWQAHIGGFFAGLLLVSLFDPIPRIANDAAPASSGDVSHRH